MCSDHVEDVRFTHPLGPEFLGESSSAVGDEDVSSIVCVHSISAPELDLDIDTVAFLFDVKNLGVVEHPIRIQL
jgi:hypothetical protein